MILEGKVNSITPCTTKDGDEYWKLRITSRGDSFYANVFSSISSSHPLAYKGTTDALVEVGDTVSVHIKLSAGDFLNTYIQASDFVFISREPKKPVSGSFNDNFFD